MLNKNKLRYTLPVAVLAAGFSFITPVFAFTESELTVTAGNRIYRYYYPEIDTYYGEPYLKNLESVANGIYLDTLVRPCDATVAFYPDRKEKFAFTNEKTGREIDKEKLCSEIKNALKNGEKNVKAVFKEISPDKTVTDLKKETNKKSEFSTRYVFSSAERKSNIKLAASKITGTKLEAGKTFSFNATVGARTEANGFKLAKIIENNKFADGIGGGVCQVSTTVYNAAILAGMTATEFHNHSLLVSYVEPSFDAMVSSGFADLKFRNDSGGNIYISCAADDNHITVGFYGLYSDYKYKRISEVVETTEAEEDEIIFTEDIPEGTEQILINGKNGAKSVGYLDVYKCDKYIGRIKLRTDSYNPLRGVRLKGGKQPINPGFHIFS